MEGNAHSGGAVDGLSERQDVSPGSIKLGRFSRSRRFDVPGEAGSGTA